MKLLTLLLAAITMSAGMAHLLELPAKIGLGVEEYFVVQSIYKGWNLIGIAEIGSILLTIFWLIREWKTPAANFLMVAATCFIVSLVVFFVFTFPANELTRNWTNTHPDWNALRARWEYSHAVRAVLNFTGFFFLINGYNFLTLTPCATARYP